MGIPFEERQRLVSCMISNLQLSSFTPEPRKAAVELEHHPSFQHRTRWWPPHCYLLTSGIVERFEGKSHQAGLRSFDPFRTSGRGELFWLLVQEGGSLQSGPKLITPFIGVKNNKLPIYKAIYRDYNLAHFSCNLSNPEGFPEPCGAGETRGVFPWFFGGKSGGAAILGLNRAVAGLQE